MTIRRERERREKTEREKNLSYEDLEWEKLLHEDLLKKQRVWHLKRNCLKKTSQNWCQLTFSCQQLYKVSPSEKVKMQVTLKQTAAQKQAKRVVRTMLCRKLRVIPPKMMNKDDDDDNVPSQNWHPTVGMTVIAMYHCQTQLLTSNSWHNWNSFSLSVYRRSIVFLVAV